LDQEGIQFDSVFDAFSDSAMVSLLFKAMGKKVFCNDLLTSSAITAVCLLENDSLPLTKNDLQFLCNNQPKQYGSFVRDNYKEKFFTESECDFLDRYKTNVETLCGEKFYCGMELLNKATLFSIPNSNFSVYGKDLKNIRSTHEVGKSFWSEKWRDTTRKRRDINNEIMFEKSIKEVHNKYKNDKLIIKNIEPNEKQNVGILTGKNNLMILDIDTKDGGLDAFNEYVREFGNIDTYCVKTCRNG
jgi:hypothetical protein